ncbi:MAG: hypothetical protein LBU62_02955, partial [Bacteroidales bacterium]|nr:hypothetical protein [Bacteroidales bacterium]
LGSWYFADEQAEELEYLFSAEFRNNDSILIKRQETTYFPSGMQFFENDTAERFLGFWAKNKYCGNFARYFLQKDSLSFVYTTTHLSKKDTTITYKIRFVDSNRFELLKDGQILPYKRFYHQQAGHQIDSIALIFGSGWGYRRTYALSADGQYTFSFQQADCERIELNGYLPQYHLIFDKYNDSNIWSCPELLCGGVDGLDVEVKLYVNRQLLKRIYLCEKTLAPKEFTWAYMFQMFMIDEEIEQIQSVEKIKFP